LLTSKNQRVFPDISGTIFGNIAVPAPKPNRADHANLVVGWTAEEPVVPESAQAVRPDNRPSPCPHPHEVDPLYLFACSLEWEEEADPSAAWELLAAARSSHDDTRAQARELLARSRHFDVPSAASASGRVLRRKRFFPTESTMNAPYGLEIIENCGECQARNVGFFCKLSPAALSSLNDVSHKSVLPAGAILFVEGQSPRGIFVLCSGKVNLSTTSREGKILILKTAEAGEPLGLSASISGMGYEATAEAETPCRVNFVNRKHFLELMQFNSDIGMHTAQCLSRDFQSAYRDIHDLVLTRSSAGKLARLLLSHSRTAAEGAVETRVHSAMTHEEMAQRIGSSRETVTRLLSDLKRKQLIRLDGPTLVIRDRTALQALAV